MAPSRVQTRAWHALPLSGTLTGHMNLSQQKPKIAQNLENLLIPLADVFGHQLDASRGVNPQY